MTENTPIDLKQRIGLPTGTFLLLTIATAGFYALYWLVRNTPLIAEAGRRPIVGEAYLLVVAGLFGWGGMLGQYGETAALLGGLLSLAGAVMGIIWAFKAKDALVSYAATTYGIDYRMNGFYTFIFGYFYINYCINEIPEEQARLHAFVNRVAST